MKTKITKYLMIVASFFLIWSAICLWVGWVNNAEVDEFGFPFTQWVWHEGMSSSTTQIWDWVDIKNNESIINRLLAQFWLNTANLEWDHKFINYAKAIMNIALWLLSMIALIMTIYTFYMMFFSENEAWIKKAKWNLIGIFIALAIIGLARLIVSVIFRWYQSNWKAKEQEISTWNVAMVIENSSNNHFYLTA